MDDKGVSDTLYKLATVSSNDGAKARLMYVN